MKEEIIKILERHSKNNVDDCITDVMFDTIADEILSLKLWQTDVKRCFSYQEALDFLQSHTPIAVKPIKKSKYKFVQPFTSINARDIVIFSLATELSKNTKYINAFDFLTELREKSEWHNLIINDNALAGKMVEFAELYFKARLGLK